MSETEWLYPLMIHSYAAVAQYIATPCPVWLSRILEAGALCPPQPRVDSEEMTPFNQ
jgi:hypothetical protein